MGESVTGRNAGVTAVLKNPTEKLSWVLTSMWRLPVLEASAWLKTEPAFSAGQNCGVSPVLRGSWRTVLRSRLCSGLCPPSGAHTEGGSFFSLVGEAVAHLGPATVLLQAWMQLAAPAWSVSDLLRQALLSPGFWRGFRIRHSCCLPVQDAVQTPCAPQGPAEDDLGRTHRPRLHARAGKSHLAPGSHWMPHPAGSLLWRASEGELGTQPRFISRPFPLGRGSMVHARAHLLPQSRSILKASVSTHLNISPWLDPECAKPLGTDAFLVSGPAGRRVQQLWGEPRTGMHQKSAREHVRRGRSTLALLFVQ